MPQSQDLASETLAMRRIEAAFAYADQLTARQRARVFRWAKEEFLDKPISADPEHEAK